MNKKIKILAVLSILLIGNNVRALDFSDFLQAVQNANTTIDLNDYDNPLVFTADLTVGSDKIFIGKFGSAFAILDGNYLRRTFSFSDRTVQFQDNFEFRRFYSTTNGGVMNILTSTVTFRGDISWIENKAQSGGAIFASSSNITFANSTANFTENTYGDYGGYGGAIYAKYSNINFTSSVVQFTRNTIGNGGYGGAIYAEYSNINFTSSVVQFTRNTTGNGGSGGAIFVFQSSISFTNSIVHFSTNTAGYGGAIYADYSNINFTSSVVNFTSNTAAIGAIYAKYSNVNFTSSVVQFTRNTATGSGGAIYAEYSNVNFTSSVVQFTRNMSIGPGGAIDCLHV